MKLPFCIVVITLLVVKTSHADQALIVGQDCVEKATQTREIGYPPNYTPKYYEGGYEFNTVPLYNQSQNDAKAVVEFNIKDDSPYAGAICEAIVMDKFCNLVNQQASNTSDTFVGLTTLKIDNFLLPADSAMFTRCRIPGTYSYPVNSGKLYSIKVSYFGQSAVVVIPF